MPARNAIYAQSGGVTAVINASACGVLQTAKQYPKQIKNVLAGKNGILGVLREELIDTSHESSEAIEGLRSLPGGAFGSCRYKLKSSDPADPDNQRLIDVFRAHDVGYFFYNGGGDSQDTINKISKLSQSLNFPIQCIGIPKTVDNDIVGTDTCPGFGSVAKYVAISTREAALDVASMAESSTKVFILEVMGRHAGWIALAAGLAGSSRNDPPHIILFPENTFMKDEFIEYVERTVEKLGYCVIVASEGIKDEDGNYISESGRTDAFGHVQLGGVAPRLASLIDEELGLKYHYAVADYLQRSARHIASLVDLEQSYAVGKAAVEAAVDGHSDVMVAIKRVRDEPYEWSVSTMNLQQVANKEGKVPKSYMRKDGYGISARGRRYLAPLIQGEAHPNYLQGLPQYRTLKNELIKRKLPTYGESL